MKKKQYIKPIVLFEDMDISDCILGVSNPENTKIISGANGYSYSRNDEPEVITGGVNNQGSIGSKESDWSYDYSFDLDW